MLCVSFHLRHPECSKNVLYEFTVVMAEHERSLSVIQRKGEPELDSLKQAKPSLSSANLLQLLVLFSLLVNREQLFHNLSLDFSFVITQLTLPGIFTLAFLLSFPIHFCLLFWFCSY